MPYIDVTAATMLSELAGDLERRGIRFVLARDIGEVRDLLRLSDGETLPAYATVEAAVEALSSTASPDR